MRSDKSGVQVLGLPPWVVNWQGCQARLETGALQAWGWDRALRHPPWMVNCDGIAGPSRKRNAPQGVRFKSSAIRLGRSTLTVRGTGWKPVGVARHSVRLRGLPLTERSNNEHQGGSHDEYLTRKGVNRHGSRKVWCESHREGQGNGRAPSQSRHLARASAHLEPLRHLLQRSACWSLHCRGKHQVPSSPQEVAVPESSTHRA